MNAKKFAQGVIMAAVFSLKGYASPLSIEEKCLSLAEEVCPTAPEICTYTASKNRDIRRVVFPDGEEIQEMRFFLSQSELRVIFPMGISSTPFPEEGKEELSSCFNGDSLEGKLILQSHPPAVTASIGIPETSLVDDVCNTLEYREEGRILLRIMRQKVLECISDLSTQLRKK